MDKVIVDEDYIRIALERFDELKSKFLEDGISNLKEHQIVELLLGCCIPKINTAPTASRIMQKFESLKRVLDASIEDLLEVDGVNETTAFLFRMIANIAHYYVKQAESRLTRIENQISAKKFCEEKLAGLQVEEMLAVCLNANGDVIGAKILEKGYNNHVQVSFRNIVTYALRNKCYRMIVAHNHPHTPPAPSIEDLVTTKNLITQCMLNEIMLVDHIIVSPLGCYSFTEHALLDNLKIQSLSFLKYSDECARYQKFCTSDPDYRII